MGRSTSWCASTSNGWFRSGKGPRVALVRKLLITITEAGDVLSINRTKLYELLSWLR